MTLPDRLREPGPLPYAAAHAALCVELAQTLPLARGLAAILGTTTDQSPVVPSQPEHARLVADLTDTLDLQAGADDILAVEGGYAALLADVGTAIDLAAGIASILQPPAPNPSRSTPTTPEPAVAESRSGLAVTGTIEPATQADLERVAAASGVSRLLLRLNGRYRNLQTAIGAINDINKYLAHPTAISAADRSVEEIPATLIQHHDGLVQVIAALAKDIRPSSQLLIVNLAANFEDGPLRTVGSDDPTGRQTTARARLLAMIETKKQSGDWMNDNLFKDPDHLLDVLLTNGQVIPGEPDNSPFMQQMRFGGRIYKVFTTDEQETWADWIRSLTESPAELAPSSLVEPPGPAWSPKRIRAMGSDIRPARGRPMKPIPEDRPARLLGEKLRLLKGDLTYRRMGLVAHLAPNTLAATANGAYRGWPFVQQFLDAIMACGGTVTDEDVTECRALHQIGYTLYRENQRATPASPADEQPQHNLTLTAGRQKPAVEAVVAELKSHQEQLREKEAFVPDNPWVTAAGDNFGSDAVAQADNVLRQIADSLRQLDQPELIYQLSIEQREACRKCAASLALMLDRIFDALANFCGDDLSNAEIHDVDLDDTDGAYWRDHTSDEEPTRWPPAIESQIAVHSEHVPWAPGERVVRFGSRTQASTAG